METINKSFDVKINVVRPFVTKNLSAEDVERITETTNLKYESLKTITPQGSSREEEPLSDEEVISALDRSLAEVDEIIQEFDDLAKKAEDALGKIAYTYDVTDLQNEIIANAERAIFGSASGVITFAKYKRVLEFQQIITDELQERMVNNGGTLNGVA